MDEQMSTYVEHHAKLKDKSHVRVLCKAVSVAC